MKKNVFYLLVIMLILKIPMMIFCQERDIKLTKNPDKLIIQKQTDTDVLYSQLAQPSNEDFIICQDATDLPEYSTEGADDFQVPDGKIWAIYEIYVIGFFTDLATFPSSVHCFLYKNDPVLNAPGDLVFSETNTNYVVSSLGNILITLPEPLLLEPGIYWVCVQPALPILTSQWYWGKQESPTINQEFHWRNPGGGFGIGCTEWTKSSLVPWGTPIPMAHHNLSFALYGDEFQDYFEPGKMYWTIPYASVAFGDDVEYPALPAGFFGPGSDPFTGVISFKGKNSNGSQQPALDAVFERKEKIYSTGLYPQNVDVETEMTQLDIVGTEPLAITIGGVTKYFDVEFIAPLPVECSDASFTITGQYEGYFNYGIPIQPVIQFTEQGNPGNIFVFDPGSTGYPPLDFYTSGNFAFTTSPLKHQIDADGEEDWVFSTSSGSLLYFECLSMRTDSLTAIVGSDGVPVTLNGTTFKVDGEDWWWYPDPDDPQQGWWNCWFWDHRFKWKRKPFNISIVAIPLPSDEASEIELVYAWDTPLWPDYPQMQRPPLPEDLMYGYEFLERSEHVVYEYPLTNPKTITYSGTLPPPYNPKWVCIDIKGKNFKLVVIWVHFCWKKKLRFQDMGDAPEGDLAYPDLNLVGSFPTCKDVPLTGYIRHFYSDTINVAYFGPGYDVEPLGNGGNCPLFDPIWYDSDECQLGPDAGLIRPSAFTITGAGAAATVVSCPFAPVIPLGPPGGTANWGPAQNIDITVTNQLVDQNVAYVNLLVDWNQDGFWNSAGSPTTEHMLVNFPVPFVFRVPLSTLLPPAFTIGPDTGYVWARFSITEVPVPFGWNGEGEFEHGETEDYLFRIAETPEKDFGDAPDDPLNLNDYPTWSASNGACHGNNPPGIFMGDLIDFESDGQPNPTATGDDLNNQDDADGIIFLTPLIPGRPASVKVDVSVNNWFLNAWIDFDGDRSWSPGEQILTDAIMPNLSNTLSFNVPANAPLGRTYARFRYSCESGLQPSGSSICGEVEDYAIYIVQPGTPKMHWPQMPKPDGWDVSFNDCSELADDFLCTESGPISYVRFWVSWKNNLVGNISNLGVTFWSDIPVWENPDGYSKPGSLLWQKVFTPNEIDIVPMDDNLQGWYNPFTNSWNLNDHTQWYQVTINNIPEPFIQEMGTVYWMEIDFGCLPNIGWKESDGPQFNDASVHWNLTDWSPIYDPLNNAPLDLSFIISSTPILTINATATPSIVCPGDNVQLDVDVSGGSGSYFYSWQSIPPGFNSNLKNPVVNPLVSTTYIVAVTDGWSFLTDEVTVTFIPPPTVNVGLDVTLGVCNTLTLIPVITGNGVSCSWAPPDFLDDPNSCNPVFGPAPTGVYLKVITVTDICGNTATDDIIITVDIAPDANAGPDAVVCESDTYLIDATGTGVGITYSWAPSTFLDNPNIEDPNFGLAPPGNYLLTLTVTDIYGCQDQDQVLITVLPEQTIALPFGLSGISSYLVPVIPNPAIDLMFASVVNDLIILFNSTMSYTPPAAPSPPGVQWNPYLGYQIRMAQARSITICGPEAVPPTINLATGWNLIPILNPANIDIVPDLSIIPQIQVIREIGGPRFWWRNGASSLNVVEPGKAYLVQVSAPCIIDFGPLKGTGGTLANPEFTNISPWNNVTATLPAHLFGFTKEACNFFENGDIVGTFTPSGLCAGMWFYDEKEGNLGIAAFGDDEFTDEIDGFAKGEPIQFRLYRPISEEIFELSVVYDPEYLNTGIYTENGLSIVSGIQVLLLGNKELDNANLCIYPNPGHGIFNIEGLKGIYNIEVLNSTGSVILEENFENEYLLNLATHPKGIYLVKITTKKEVIYRKIIVQ